MNMPSSIEYKYFEKSNNYIIATLICPPETGDFTKAYWCFYQLMPSWRVTDRTFFPLNINKSGPFILKATGGTLIANPFV
jgi:hypothetical protein